MNDRLKRLIDNLEFEEEAVCNQLSERCSSNIHICSYLKEIFEKISFSIDIETTLNIIMDILNEYLSPQRSFVLTASGDIVLERNLGSLSDDFVPKLDREGVLGWVRDEGKQTFKFIDEHTIAVAPLDSESNFLGYLVIVIDTLEITPNLTDLIYISSQVLSLFLSKKDIYTELIEKSDNLEVKVAELKGLYQELLIVYDFVNEVGSIFDEQSLFVTLIAMCSRAMEINQGFVLRYDSKKNRLHTIAATHSALVGQRYDATGFIDIFNGPSNVVNSETMDMTALQELLQIESILVAPICMENSLYALVVLSERKTNKPYSEQDERILLSLARQAGNCLQNIRLHEQLIEKKKIERDLELASDIQMSLLPKKPPQIQGLDIATFFKPVKQVGGDFYSFHQVDRHNCWFFLGDVSGKGMAAALVMATLRSMLQFEMRNTSENAGELLTSLNNLLCPDMYEGNFITFWAGLVDLGKEDIFFSNAGHLPLLVYRSHKDLVESYEALDIPLGIMDNVNYPYQNICFAKGDILVLYTDGINESMSSDKEEFGLNRLKQLLKDTHQGSSQEIVQDILQAVNDFADDAPQYDDISLMVIKRDSN
jgi:serine phosphatase RsbU (regulator of sigma subunit)